jgi:methenyltetrahydromethanopterin cyclohydrolase
VARVLEVAIHKVHELGFPLDRIESGFGTAPLPPIGKNFVSAMGRTNDSIIYGGNVQLVINGPEDDLIDLAKKLPSSNSKDYGKTFKKIFEEYNQDFYKIDGSLFSPARVIINSKESGKTYKSGDINKKIIKNSFES